MNGMKEIRMSGGEEAKNLDEVEELKLSSGMIVSEVGSIPWIPFIPVNFPLTC
jgi:hypothetical protein